MSLEDIFVLRNVRELLGSVCDPQLCLLSKSCHAAMATVPREEMRLEDFLSSLALFLWAGQVLEMPWSRDQLCEVAAGGTFGGAAVGPRGGASLPLGRGDCIGSGKGRASAGGAVATRAGASLPLEHKLVRGGGEWGSAGRAAMDAGADASLPVGR